MERYFYAKLLKWKEKKDRMPLVLIGARQVGKTYLLKSFGEREFKNVHIFNFQVNPELSRIFAQNLDPMRIINELSISQKREINTRTDLVFLDEIQECEGALNSLKFFYESHPEIALVCAGSLLGVKLGSSSFPVGSVSIMHLYPMTFGEFIDASQDDMVRRVFHDINRLESAHRLLWDYCRHYFFTGGMPKAVQQWFSDVPITEKIESVRDIQNDIILGYEKDAAKHAGKINALHIAEVMNNVPRQLSMTVDDTVKRYKFKDVIPGRRTFTQLSGPISWLEHAGLVYKTYIIESKPRVPLQSLVKENIFKLFLFDVGLLGAMLELSYQTLMDQDYGTTKGFFAENFVASEFKALGINTLYSWSESSAEIEFLHVTDDGMIIPVEVKSGSRTQAKSLKSYCERYNPPLTIKLVGKAGGTDKKNLVVPLYYASKLKELLANDEPGNPDMKKA